MGLFEFDHGVIVACDVPRLEGLDLLVYETHGVDGIVGYKIGKQLGMPYGMKEVVDTIRKYTEKPIIWDEQKEGNDVKFTISGMANAYKQTGIPSLIIFPLVGAENQIGWVEHSRLNGIEPIAGFELTQPLFYSTDEGMIDDVLKGLNLPEEREDALREAFEDHVFHGYIDPSAKDWALEVYAKLGVEKYIAPGNKPDAVKDMRGFLISHGVTPTFLMPGMGRQEGEIPTAFEAAGAEEGPAYAIIGSAIYRQPVGEGKRYQNFPTPREAAEFFAGQALEFE